MKTTQSRTLHQTLAIIFATFFITVSSGVMAQANGGSSSGALRGLGSFTGAGGNGGNSTVNTSGGAGGGSGISGGAGGSGTGGAGGLGGTAPGGAGQVGTAATSSNQSGGGGGGGAAGLVVTTDYTNSGSVAGGAGGAGGAGNGTGAQGSGGGGGTGAIVNGSVILTNTGSVTGGAGVVSGGNGVSGTGVGLVNNGSVVNSGTISGGNNALVVGGFGIRVSASTSSSITNTATGIISGNSQDAIQNDSGTLANLINHGTISGFAGYVYGIENDGTITTLTNTGTISSSTLQGIYNDAGTITTLTNTGTISSSTLQGIYNDGGTITTLNNLQGLGNAAGALTYTGTLPTNYSIIINSTTSFGKLSVTSGTGSTTFGIYTGSTVTAGYRYTSVLSGIGSSNLAALTGTYGSYSWTLAPQATCTTNCIYDLTISGSSGPPSDDTQKSIVATAAALQNTFALQNAVLANSFSYDCNTFGANNVCVSAGGRNTAVSAANGLNNTSGLLIAAYRPHPNYRIGAYADQNLSVNNAGSTVSLGNNTPLIGLFGAWNERLDGTGTEVKVSAAYGQKNTTVTRAVVGTSEPGSGSSQLNSQGAQVTAKHGFVVKPEVIVSPYIGMRYTQNNMQGYTEGTSTTVTAPLAYSALNTNATTALAGVGASYRVIPTLTTFASAGVETDTNTANGSYYGTSSSITGLTPVNFNANPVKTRPTAMLGASYEIEKNQRLGITGIYRQESYQAVSTTTVMATYTVGL